METSSAQSGADRRARYLAAALARFAHHGFDGTTMDMLVADVGGSKATLYKHFPSKNALVAGLMDDIAAGISRPGLDAERDERPLEAVLTEIGTAALRGVVAERAVTVLRLCLGEYPRFPELARTVWEHGPAVTYATFTAFLEERQRRGEIRVDDPQLAAEHFVAGIVGHLQLKVAMGMAAPPDEPEIARRVAAAVRAFLAAYAVAGAAPARPRREK